VKTILPKVPHMLVASHQHLTQEIPALETNLFASGTAYEFVDTFSTQ